MVPGKKGHLIESPAVVYPDYIWGVWTIKVAFVYIKAHSIEEYAHEMSEKVGIKDKFY